MFTGIITHQGIVKNAGRSRENKVVSLSIPRARLKRGESLAVNGVCLTVDRVVRGQYIMAIMPETLRRTALRYLKKGDKVNIELPLKYGQRLGGHFVLGHIDDIGRVKSAKKGKHGNILRIQFASRFNVLTAQKGSISVDGVSLTVVARGRDWFSVALIPHTVKNTTLGVLKIGDFVNLEFDIFARYIHAARYKKNKE